ncbi:hypothetical protein FZC37_03125 (plasmid) [Candidatus Sneabacter namystus]|uniref:Uncharacterized protein n=2 Tax=Candidatus Sneabacter namystus TaxID=2601646 RepID=A0A5C0ULY8_9RICK|nr:hypothetical protein FZC37_03125 [Candidatus Sneabacter namystus]
MLEESDGAKDLRSEILESIDEIKSVISVIDKAGFIQVEKDVLECEKAFEQFDSALSKVFSRHAPKLQQVSQSLTYCVSLVKGIKEIIQKREEEEARQAAAALAEKERLAALSEGGVGGSPAATSSLALESLSPDQLNKEQALSLLVVLSKFFKNSDPHSPIAYSLERIERWAKLSLPEMMLDIVSSDVMMSYCKITGVPFAKSGNEERDGDYYD